MAVTSVINLGSSDARLKLASKSALREKTSLKFLVKFFDNSKPEWLVWKDIYTATELHNYLKNNNLDHLILERFKDMRYDSEGTPLFDI
jgi:hypothetical protein